MGEYLPTGNKVQGTDLPGMGGVYNSYNLGLYTYAHSNPVRYSDPDGNSATSGVLTGLSIDLSAPEPTDAVPVKWAAWGVALVGAVATDAVIYMTMSGDSTQDRTSADVQYQSNENDDSTVIYRWGSGSNTNMTPREKDKTGLSFSTQKPAKGKYSTTTMGAINATGSLMAVKDGVVMYLSSLQIMVKCKVG